jgi:tripartite-type tricarboxylate transporter receptor subunit TctC
MRSEDNVKRLALFALLALALTSAVPASAQAQQPSPFKNNQVAISIGFGVGGTYYQYAQLFARNLGRFLPGEPTIIVQSMPGAGGVRLLNEAANRMPADGSNIFLPPDTMLISQLLEQSGVNFDAARFAYIGTADQQNTFLATRRAAASTVDDLKNRQTFMGSSGSGSTGYLIPAIASPLLGLKTKSVGGFTGSSDIILAMERGEIDGSAQGWQVWTQARADWFKGPNSYAVPIFQSGVTPDPEAPDVPFLSKLVKPDDVSLAALLDTMGLIGRSLALPPNTPPTIAAMFRTAFERMVADETFRKDAATARLRSIPKTGEQLDSGIRKALAGADNAVIARAREMIK